MTNSTTETDDTHDTDSTASSDETPADEATNGRGSTDEQLSLAGFGGHVPPDNACTYYSECENTVPGNNDICADCLDAIRAADREADD